MLILISLLRLSSSEADIIDDRQSYRVADKYAARHMARFTTNREIEKCHRELGDIWHH